MKRLFVLFVVLFVFALPSAAQELSGRIEGTVTDPQGAVIPGANITAVHADTNTTYRATTTAVGHFAIPRVRLGAYRITIESLGFRRGVVTGLKVEVGSTASVNVKLELGEVTEEITVSAEVSQEIVNTSNAALGGVVDNQKVLQLPLNGRNAAELVFLQAGTYYETDADGMGNKLFVHGQRHRSVNFTLDGVDTQDNLNRASSIMVNQPLIAMSAENVQEFQVATGISSAEFSRGGAQVSSITRSGGNQFHGSAFWFHRNTVLNANDFFNNIVGEPRPDLLRHQFGGRVGGPIWTDKLFFYFGYQQTREKRGLPVHRVVWDTPARNGIFQWIDSAGALQSMDLLACGATSCNLSGFTPANPPTIDPFIQNVIFANMPLPNTAGGDGLNTSGFRFNSPILAFEHLPAARIDYRINDKHLFYASWNYTDRNINGDFINGREPVWPTLEALGFRQTLSNQFTGALVSNFSPTMINEFRIGRIGGENAFIYNQPFDTPEFTLDLNDVTDPYSPGGGSSARDNVTLHVRDGFTWVRGNHQFKFGGEWRYRSVDNNSVFGVLPMISMDDNDVSLIGCPSGMSSGDCDNFVDLANTLVGAIGAIDQRFVVTSVNDTMFAPPGTSERRKYFNREMDLFFQDDWNLRSNLTLNLGVRWEWAGIPDESQGLILLPEGGADAVFGNSGPDGFFSPGTLTGKPCPPLSSTIASPSRSDVDNLFNLCAIQNVAGGSKNGAPLFDNDLNNFGPVVGVAWDPWGTGRTSFRAGYRISYMQDVFSIIDGNVDDNEGLTIDEFCTPTGGTGALCQNNPLFLRNVVDGSGSFVLAGAPLSPVVPSFQLPILRSIRNSSAQDFRTYDDNLNTAYYQEWSFGIQREFFRNWALDVRYVGTRGHALRRVADFNEYNLLAVDPGGPGRTSTGQSFLDAFLIARNNLLLCDATPGCSSSFEFNSAIPGSQQNNFMTFLISPDPARFRTDNTTLTALRDGSTGEFLRRYLATRTTRPTAGISTSNRTNGGAFFGHVLSGQLPLNFFNANPFVGSSRRMVGDGFSTYHAAEIEVRRRTAGGFAFQANYTFQRALADFDGDENTLINDTRPSSVINPRYTTQEFMPRQVFNANWLYELPVGPGKPWDPANSFVRQALGGWQFGGIVNWRSGRPFSIFSGVGMFHRTAISGDNTVNLSQGMGIGALRKLIGQRNITTSGGPGVFWFDPCLSSQVVGFTTGGACTDANATQGLFQLPDPGELGQLPLSLFFGPRRFLFDFNLAKRFKITEGTDFEFRWEVFNAFNNANFQLPNNNVFDDDFGRIFRTVTRPREMQFALKINF